jgi:hypothetical protein
LPFDPVAVGLSDGQRCSAARGLALGVPELVYLLEPMSSLVSKFLALSWAKGPVERMGLVRVVSNGLSIATSDYVVPTTCW